VHNEGWHAGVPLTIGEFQSSVHWKRRKRSVGVWGREGKRKEREKGHTGIPLENPELLLSPRRIPRDGSNALLERSVGDSSGDLDGDMAEVLEVGEERLVRVVEGGREGGEGGDTGGDHPVGELGGAGGDDTAEMGREEGKESVSFFCSKAGV
jgi:hypothetical protein